MSKNIFSPFSPGVTKTIVLATVVGCLTWFTKAIRAPRPRLCGSRGGPTITAPRIKLRDGRHLAYKEYVVPKDKAKHKFIFVHAFGCSRHNVYIANDVSPDTIESLGLYFVGFDRPGYGESDPNPNRTPQNMALDIEELADQLGLGPKFYVVGYSMGGELVWGCLKYIPHRLAGATLLTPVVNYWWSGLPAKLATEAFYVQPPQDQWSLRVAYYAPWLTYWWQTQKLFPGSSVIASGHNNHSQDKIVAANQVYVSQQGEHESLFRDMMVGFGKWEFSPIELENPFPNNEGTVHLWQGDKDVIVPITLQQYIAKRLPWIRYHEIPGVGHSFPSEKGLGEAIIKAQLSIQD